MVAAPENYPNYQLPSFPTNWAKPETAAPANDNTGDLPVAKTRGAVLSVVRPPDFLEVPELKNQKTQKAMAQTSMRPRLSIAPRLGAPSWQERVAEAFHSGVESISEAAQDGVNKVRGLVGRLFGARKTNYVPVAAKNNVVATRDLNGQKDPSRAQRVADFAESERKIRELDTFQRVTPSQVTVVGLPNGTSPNAEPTQITRATPPRTSIYRSRAA
ncbi:hypothetical protein IPJ72_01110 [Candidatus Peregrinibacteria bacterium]|nr:MAG: hypothetical protein IPJ72_01110 [Candidatus Peregrinibacteria bacterium]